MTHDLVKQLRDYASCDLTVSVGEHAEMLSAAADAIDRLTTERDAAWRPISEAQKDGSAFWGNVEDDAIRMFWHEGFGEFVSSYRQMQTHNGHTFGDGSTVKDHSPEIHRPTHFMVIRALSPSTLDKPE